MDTTPKYIKMCEKAEEIQKGWKASNCDIYYDKGGAFFDYGPDAPIIWWQTEEGISHITSEFIDCIYRKTFDIKKAIYLPRQDQLQEMVDNLQTTPYSMFKALIEWYNDPHGYGSIPFPKHIKELELWWEYVDSLETSEQLWLTFVMKEKFNKIWNDKEWIKK